MKSLGFGQICFFLLQQVLGLVSSQNIGNQENLLRSCPVLISVLRLKAHDSRCRPSLVPHLIIKNSQSWTRPFVNFSSSLCSQSRRKRLVSSLPDTNIFIYWFLVKYEYEYYKYLNILFKSLNFQIFLKLIVQKDII